MDLVPHISQHFPRRNPAHRGGGRPHLSQIIHLGEHREGLLRASEPIRNEIPHGPENRWDFEGRAGQRVTIDAESYEFDVYLLLVDRLDHTIVARDNNKGFFNAHIQTTLQTTEQYTVVVCGANADQCGTYWLSLDEGDRDAECTEDGVETYYRQGIEWGERMMSRRARSWLDLGMAQYFRQRRQWEKAEKYCDEGLARAEEDDFTYVQWAVALERGRLYARRRSYDQAVRELQRALQLSKSLRDRADTEILALIEFGKLYYSTARADLAKVYFETATKQAQNILPSTLVELYTSLNSSLALPDKDRAIAYAEEPYSLREELDPVLELECIHSMAATYLFLEPNKSKQGLALAYEMRNRANRLGCPDEEVEAITLISMDKYATNNIEDMIRLATEALGLTNPVDENPNPRRIALQLQADGEMSRGNYEAALRSCQEALRIVESAWANEYIEELRRELLSQSRSICTQIIKNLYAVNARHPSMEYARQAFDYSERCRSRSLLEHLLTVDKPVDLGVDRQALGRDREILDKLSAVRGQLALLRASDYASSETLRRLQEQRANPIGEHMHLQADIRQSIRNSYHAVHISPVTAEEAQKKISEYHPNSAILNYQLGIQESFLIVSTRSGSYIFKLPDWKTISKAVAGWRVQVQSQLHSSHQSDEAFSNYNQIAHLLYNFLIAPAAQLIRGRDLIMIPSDALCQIAFEALVLNDTSRPGQRPEYLIEQHAISYVPSASVLSEIESRWQPALPAKRMLLLGDAIVADNDTKIEQGDHRPTIAALDRLPAARLEVLEIARLAEQHRITATILLDSLANEDDFKARDLSVFRYIHIATHGMSDYQDGDASALTLAANAGGSEDGILTGDEIAKLKLKAELVVLSGCETGSGQKDGAEGIVGLNRAFLIAGARCVCGSLWPVEDASTRKLMNSFYRRLIVNGLSKSHALRLAKLEMIKSGMPPSRWAPFILIGTPR